MTTEAIKAIQLGLDVLNDVLLCHLDEVEVHGVVYTNELKLKETIRDMEHALAREKAKL